MYSNNMHVPGRCSGLLRGCALAPTSTVFRARVGPTKASKQTLEPHRRPQPPRGAPRPHRESALPVHFAKESHLHAAHGKQEKHCSRSGFMSPTAPIQLPARTCISVATLTAAVATKRPYAGIPQCPSHGIAETHPIAPTWTGVAVVAGATKPK